MTRRIAENAAQQLGDALTAAGLGRHPYGHAIVWGGEDRVTLSVTLTPADAIRIADLLRPTTPA